MEGSNVRACEPYFEKRQLAPIWRQSKNLSSHSVGTGRDGRPVAWIMDAVS
jgi:hypothetical protein